MLAVSNSAFFFFQAEDGIRDLVRSRGLGDVYKRQPQAVYSNGVLTELSEAYCITIEFPFGVIDFIISKSN